MAPKAQLKRYRRRRRESLRSVKKSKVVRCLTSVTYVIIILHSITNLILSLFIIIAVLGILGNGIIVFAFVAKLMSITPFMVLLSNLSIADIVIDVSVFPFLFWRPSERDTHFTCGFHKLVIPWSATLLNAATLTYISFVRINAFLGKALSQSLLKPRTVNVYVALTWLFGIALFLPHCFNSYYDSNLGVCTARAGYFYKISAAIQALL